jgi:hypothetical protein
LQSPPASSKYPSHVRPPNRQPHRHPLPATPR